MTERRPRRTLRISTDENGTKWIENRDADGEWTRLASAEPFRAGEARRLNASLLNEIADSESQPQKQIAEEALSATRAVANAATRTPLEKLTEAFKEPVPLADPAEVEEAMRTFRMPDPYARLKNVLPTDIEPIPDRIHEVIARLDKQNQLLERQLDEARKDAEEQRNIAAEQRRYAADEHRRANRALVAAWVAAAIALLSFAAQIVFFFLSR